MSYKSHSKSASRAFDHLYDPVHKSTKKGLQKMNFKALSKTAPLHIIPCHSTMFTDLLTRPRNFYFSQRNPLPIIPSESHSRTTNFCDRAINTNLFVYNPAVHYDAVFREEIYHIKPKLMRSVGIQTKYRESSAQTEPWLPDAKLRDGEKNLPEILLISCNTDPGLNEIETIERARVRRNWEKALPKVTDSDFPSRIALIKAFEFENLVARERHLNECQMGCMNQVSEMIEQRQENHNSYANGMLENVQKRNEIENQSKKSKLSVSLQRKLRKLSKKKCMSDDIQEPMIRQSKLIYGKKSFKPENGLFASGIDFNKTLKFKNPLNQRMKLWQPKKLINEAAHGFLKEDNLKSLFESVKKLSERGKRESLRCRTKREVMNETRGETIAKLDDMDDELFQNQVEVQKTIKGQAVKNLLENGVRECFDKVQMHRKIFPIECVQRVLPEQYFDLFPKTDQKNLHQLIQFDSRENLGKVVEPLVNTILEEADQMISTAITKKILLETEQLRVIRREEARQEALQEKIAELRRIEIQQQIDGSRRKISETLLNKILPAVVEIIADTEAFDYAKIISSRVDDEASNTELTESQIAHNLLHQITVPEVVKRIENLPKNDEQLTVLIAAKNAFEIYLQSLSLNVSESEIICENIVENI